MKYKKTHLITAALAGVFLCLNSYAAPWQDSKIAKNAWVSLAKIEKQYHIPSGLLLSMSLVETGQGLKGYMMPWPYTINLNSPGEKTFTNKQKALNELAYWKKIGFTRFTVTANGQYRKRIKPQAASELVSKALPKSNIKIRPHHRSKRFESEGSAVRFVENLLARGYKNVDIGLMQINWRYHGNKFTSVRSAFDAHSNAMYAVRYLMEHRQTRNWWQSVGRYHSGTKKYAKRYIKSVWNMYQRVHRISPKNRDRA